MTNPTHTITPVTVLEGHDDRVWDVAWNPSQPLLASCSADRTIRIASLLLLARASPSDFTNVSQIPTGHKRTVRSLAWSPSGQTLAAASFDSQISIWERGGAGEDWECSATLEGHETEVKGVAFNAEGTMLATCGRDKSVWIWEVHPDSDFECLSVQMDHSQDVKAVAWHPTHDILASCSYDDSIKLYLDDPSDDWYPFATLTAHASTVWDVVFSPCGRFFASVGDDLTLRIWRAKDEKLREWTTVRVVENAHKRSIYSVAWGRGEGGGLGWIATTGGDGTVNVWAVQDGEGGTVDATLIARREETHGVSDANVVRWCPMKGYEHVLATGGDDNVVRVWAIQPNTSTD
ncbi:WD40 repeat-like protein [Auriculariales sp. MPI-PUGE-AT-0066]|nr:WD40 repeat-like protein [Auriculariales sp. MPI-PUGE-AT-0066]